MNGHLTERFSAQLGLIGEEGQDKLLSAHVLVVGAGGLGAPVIQYLAAAGIRLTICDGDVVEPSNLNRQVLYTDSDAFERRPKASQASYRVMDLGVPAASVNRRVTGDDLRELMRSHDLVVAAVDNMETRFEINDIGVEEDIPVVHGACSGWHGQVMLSPGRAGPCYRCMFDKEPTRVGERAGMEKGVMGTTCGIVGSFMAQQAIKWLLNDHRAGFQFLDIDCFWTRIMPVVVPPVVGCKAGDHDERPRPDLEEASRRTGPSEALSG